MCIRDSFFGVDLGAPREIRTVSIVMGRNDSDTDAVNKGQLEVSIPERVDLRSYARQGLDIVPTVHEGAAVRQMEKRGIQTNIGNLNREIRAANRLMKSIRQLCLLYTSKRKRKFRQPLEKHFHGIIFAM